MNEYVNGLTLRELKTYLNSFPELDDNGDEVDIWITTGQGLSSPVTKIFPFTGNRGILLESSKEYE